MLMSDLTLKNGKAVIDRLKEKITELPANSVFTLHDLLGDDMAKENDLTNIGRVFHELVEEGEFQCEEIEGDFDVKRYKKKDTISPFVHPKIYNI